MVLGRVGCLTTWILSVFTASAQFIDQPSPDVFATVDGPLGIQVRFKEVSTGPGTICELHPEVRSYSGFVDVGPHQHVFFWFFEARDVDPQDAPLTAWLSGGPGVSSMDELFTEHGPCKVDPEGNVRSNPHTWNARSNTVYIDQPISVGFSYSDPVPGYVSQKTCDIEELEEETCPGNQHTNVCYGFGSSVCGTFSKQHPSLTANSTPNAAPTFWRALQGLFATFPKHTSNGFVLASESYGGHYAPVFAKYIHDQNLKLASTHAADRSINQSAPVSIPLKSVFVTNGWFDPAVGYEAYASFLANPGNTYGITISDHAGQKMQHAVYGPNECLDRLSVCNSPNGTDHICKTADDYCGYHVRGVYHRHLDLRRDQYDVRYLAPSPFPNGNHIAYLNLPHVQRELGVFTNFTEESTLVGNAFYATGDDGRELGITQALADLLDAGISITMQHGDADYSCNWYGGEEMWSHIAQASQSLRIKGGQPHYEAGYQDLEADDCVFHGQVKQAGSLSFVRVFQAGHGMGFFQPLANQAIFERTIGGVDIATGLIDVKYPYGDLYVSQGPKKSHFFEGNGTVQYHKVPSDATYNHTTNEPDIPKK